MPRAAAANFPQGSPAARGSRNHSHEVRIAEPARQHMHVQMASHPGARRLTQIQPQIDAVGRVGAFQCTGGALRQRHHLQRRLRRQSAQ